MSVRVLFFFFLLHRGTEHYKANCLATPTRRLLRVPKERKKKNTTAFKRDSAYAYVYEDYALVEELDWTYAVIQAVGIYICAGKSVISYHKTSSDGVFLVVVDSPFTVESKQVNSENLPIDIYYDTPHMRGNRAIYPGSYASDQVDSFYNFKTPCFFSLTDV